MSATGEHHATLTELGRVREAIQEIVLRTHEYEIAEIRLADYNGRISDLNKAETALLFAARKLARSIDARPLDKQPPGWSI